MALRAGVGLNQQQVPPQVIPQSEQLPRNLCAVAAAGN